MDKHDVIGFLKATPPFDSLGEALLERVAGSVTEQVYPAGAAILYQEGPASKHLKIIRRGGVKVSVSTDVEGDTMIDYRGPGSSLGFISLMTGDRSRANVVASEETLCYLVPRAIVQEMLDASPEAAEFFYKSFFYKYIEKAYKDIQTRNVLCTGGDRLLFTTPVGAIASKGVHTAPDRSTIHEAAVIMTRNRISSLIITDSAGVPRGIVTDRDLRDKVLARGRDPMEPVGNIMSTTLVRGEAREYCFESLLRMIRHGIHHLLVVDEGRLVGVVTNHDIMLLQGTSPISVVKEIEAQWDIDSLAPAAHKIMNLITLLLKEGAKASQITHIITEVNDRLERRVFEIAERALGKPPLPYCWIVYGSEGRREQTFKTDQDNGLIYADPADGREAAAAEAYFEKFSAFVASALVRCGFSRCPGNYMASNPQWRKPLSVWKGYFKDWINSPTPEAILYSVILFDYRALYGDVTLAEALRDDLTQRLRHQDMFLKFMAKLATGVKPPLGIFGTLKLEKDGPHKGALNLKHKLIAPLINIIRLFALEKGVSETGSLERISALLGRHNIVREFGDDLSHAFESVMLLRIQHQHGQLIQGRDPDNYVHPDRLTSVERKLIKETAQLIGRMQDIIDREYNPGTRL